MGLFSFLKNAGAKLFNRDSKTVAPEVKKTVEADALRNAVHMLGIPIENLDIDVNDDVVTVFGTVKSQADRERVILVLGNVAGVATVDDRISVEVPEPESVFYEVKKGDSLSKIAKNFYGDPMKYPVIFEANKPMLKDPDLIYPGQMLRIPPM